MRLTNTQRGGAQMAISRATRRMLRESTCGVVSSVWTAGGCRSGVDVALGPVQALGDAA